MYRFETVQVDVRKQILSVDGRPVDVEPKPFALLAVLAEANGGLVSKNELLERLWPRQVVSEAVLTQCVLRARQAIGDTAHRIIVTVHRQGYRLGVPLHEQDAPIAPQPDEPEQASPLPLIQPKRRWLRVALLALVLVGAVLYTLLRSKFPPATPSVAVMPLEVRDGDDDDRRIASGLSDALLTRLAQNPRLRVPARTSVGIAAAHRNDLRQVGRELLVTHVLEGLMRRDGENYTLHLGLVRTSDGFQQWARRFDIARGELASAETMIASEVGGALVGQPGMEQSLAPIGTDSDEAYRAYLNGNALRYQRTEASLRWAIERYSDALRIDPQFAAAHAGSANAWMLLYEYSNLSLADAQRAAQEHVDAALRLAPAQAIGYSATGLLLLDSGDALAAEKALRKAVGIDPADATTQMWLGTSLTYQGRVIEARKWHAQALALDPLSAVAEVYLGIDEALAFEPGAAARFERAIAHDPRLLESYWQNALFERFRDNPQAARKHLEQALEIEPSSEYTRALLADTLLASADSEGAARVLGAGSDGSLAIWLRSAIAVARSTGDRARQDALCRISAERRGPHPEDRLLVATALACLGEDSASLQQFEVHIAASNGNDPFVRLFEPDFGIPDLMQYLDLLRSARGGDAAKIAAEAARHRLLAMRDSGVRPPILERALAGLQAIIVADREIPGEGKR
ncbi:MAG: winged helix-turn-helix domain-containing protein [Dokdonella sp.]